MIPSLLVSILFVFVIFLLRSKIILILQDRHIEENDTTLASLVTEKDLASASQSKQIELVLYTLIPISAHQPSEEQPAHYEAYQGKMKLEVATEIYLIDQIEEAMMTLN